MPDDSDNGTSRIGLAEAIRELRAELMKARREGANEDIRFAVGDIEVELSLEFGATREAGGGLKIFSFLNLSGKVGASDKAAHKLKLKLTVDAEKDPGKGRISDAKGPKPVDPPPGA